MKMSEFKGTPGPWGVNIIGQHWNNKSLTQIEITFGDEGECICDTVYKAEDANLIAAAPELLKELQALVSRCRIYVNTSDAQAAIAKALGESK
ncbi:hypothetical protein PRB79_gp37 [Klebsiella phage VLCpiS13d]|uniref:hypothetical protein n=1 Tax=Klebsiella phage VLCpiS13d TaxID=2874888 RepID=UPI00233EF65C|nr:hypothetical protein PRB79_gp37 [Klebsiella phage VLCpiS13d]UVX31701.1 hypothetical protein S13d_00037 [Klebsiella phage VLCpiS13d]